MRKMNFEEFKNIIFLLLSEDKECRTLGVELGKIYDLEIKPFFWNIKIYTKSNWLIRIDKSNPSILVETYLDTMILKRALNLI